MRRQLLFAPVAAQVRRVAAHGAENKMVAVMEPDGLPCGCGAEEHLVHIVRAIREKRQSGRLQLCAKLVTRGLICGITRALVFPVVRIGRLCLPSAPAAAPRGAVAQCVSCDLPCDRAGFSIAIQVIGMIPPCAVDRKAPYAVRARIEHDIHLRVIRVHRRKRQYAPLHFAVGRETRIIEQPAPAAALRAAVEPVPLRAVHAVDVHDPVQEQIVRLLLLPRAGAGFVGYIFRAVRAQRRREAAFKQLLLFFAHLPGKGLVAGRLRAVTQNAKRGILVASLLIGLGQLAVRVGVLGINFNRRRKGQNGLFILPLGQVAHAEVILCLPAGRFVRRFGGFRGFLARGKRQQQNYC